MKRTISYEIIDGDRRGYFHLYRIVRRGAEERRELIDVRCCRKRLEYQAWIWQQPGGWTNFF